MGGITPLPEGSVIISAPRRALSHRNGTGKDHASEPRLSSTDGVAVFGASKKRKGCPAQATLSEIQGDGPVRASKSNRWFISQGLPLENTPSDCPDTSLQYHSRHWITSFQMVADRGRVTQILCLSKQFTQPLWPTGQVPIEMATMPLRQAEASRASHQRPAKPRTGPRDQGPEVGSAASPRTRRRRAPGRSARRKRRW